jgi:hypothetical protein
MGWSGAAWGCSGAGVPRCADRAVFGSDLAWRTNLLLAKATSQQSRSRSCSPQPTALIGRYLPTISACFLFRAGQMIQDAFIGPQLEVRMGGCSKRFTLDSHSLPIVPLQMIEQFLSTNFPLDIFETWRNGRHIGEKLSR